MAFRLDDLYTESIKNLILAQDNSEFRVVPNIKMPISKPYYSNNEIFYFDQPHRTAAFKRDCVEVQFIVSESSDKIFEWRHRLGQIIQHKEFGIGSITHLDISDIHEDYGFMSTVKPTLGIIYKITMEAVFPNQKKEILFSPSELNRKPEIKVKSILESKDREFDFDD